ncbi:MAG TPA: hypothetical protein VFC02_26570, partial [Anaerolineales bacterium]|nr:hypothetical protein [Anaerolineales bacterium]
PPLNRSPSQGAVIFIPCTPLPDKGYCATLQWQIARETELDAKRLLTFGKINIFILKDSSI